MQQEETTPGGAGPYGEGWTRHGDWWIRRDGWRVSEQSVLWDIDDTYEQLEVPRTPDLTAQIRRETFEYYDEAIRTGHVDTMTSRGLMRDRA